MKKSVIYIFLLGVIFGIIGYFAVQSYIEQQRKLELEKLNLITSLEDFVSRISFYDGGALTMAEADMIYYDYVGAKTSNVFMFSAREHYAQNVRNQEMLNQAINFLRGSKKLKGITFSKKITLPEMKTHKALHTWDSYADNSFLKIKELLEKKLKRASISIEEMSLLHYTYSLEGDYVSAERLEKTICQKSKKDCKKKETVLITGTVLDLKGKPLKNTTISVLNYSTQKPAITGEDGSFQLNIQTNSLEKIRLRALKRGYSDGFRDFYVYRPEGENYEETILKKEANFTLNQSHAIVALDLDNNKIDLTKKGIVKSANFKDNQFIIRIKNNIYKIPKNVFINIKKESVLSGNVEVHFYEFDRDSSYDMENLVLADISSEEGQRMFLGGFLTTFGMPYMQFYSEKGEELFVGKANPIYLTYQLVEMEELRIKYNKDRPITEEDLEALVALSSKSEESPLSREYLNTLPFDFPPWWMLNRKKGMWENVPFKMLDTKGLLETTFYSYD